MSIGMLNSVPYSWSVDVRAPTALLDSAEFKFVGAFDIHVSEQFEQGWTCKKRGTAKKVQLQFMANGQLISLVFKSISQKNFSNRLNIRPYQRASYVTIHLPNHGVSCVLFAVEHKRAAAGYNQQNDKVSILSLPVKPNLVAVNPTDDKKIPLLMLNSGKDTNGAHTVVAFFSHSNANMNIQSHSAHADNHVLKVAVQQMAGGHAQNNEVPALSKSSCASDSASAAVVAPVPVPCPSPLPDLSQAMDNMDESALSTRKRSRDEYDTDADNDKSESEDEAEERCSKSRRIDEDWSELSPLSLSPTPSLESAATTPLSSNSDALPDLSDMEEQELDSPNLSGNSDSQLLTSLSLSPLKPVPTPNASEIINADDSSLEEFALPAAAFRLSTSADAMLGVDENSLATSSSSSLSASSSSSLSASFSLLTKSGDDDADSLHAVSLFNENHDNPLDITKFFNSALPVF